jgi:hypothetical protein
VIPISAERPRVERNGASPEDGGELGRVDLSLIRPDLRRRGHHGRVHFMSPYGLAEFPFHIWCNATPLSASRGSLTAID